MVTALRQRVAATPATVGRRAVANMTARPAASPPRRRQSAGHIRGGVGAPRNQRRFYSFARYIRALQAEQQRCRMLTPAVCRSALMQLTHTTNTESRTMRCRVIKDNRAIGAEIQYQYGVRDTK